jgi:hypothetical protein
MAFGQNLPMRKRVFAIRVGCGVTPSRPKLRTYFDAFFIDCFLGGISGKWGSYEKSDFSWAC